MAVEPISDQGQTLSYPSGKVLGIVDTREQFDEVVAALKRAGFDGITALHGEDGVQLLERVNNFFFTKLEEKVLQRHIQELKEGRFIIAVETTSSQVKEVANIAAEHGARRLIHFGFLSINWLTG
jgi:phosphoribosylaminoimidazole-succinocarboxamide synthase